VGRTKITNTLVEGSIGRGRGGNFGLIVLLHVAHLPINRTQILRDPVAVVKPFGGHRFSPAQQPMASLSSNHK
ncbi:hypothetical protein, partial [Ferrimicrobium sp.]|uniref:hypothetical protein n=1 Tax=Ferrimicrobium sp. TaxID=2926050 RepID=UPI00262C8465